MPAKLFQTEESWGCVLAIDKQGAEPSTEHVLITSEGIRGPQVLQRTTAECIAQAIIVGPLVRPLIVSGFKWRTRLVCTGRYEAQLAAERGINTIREG